MAWARCCLMAWAMRRCRAKDLVVTAMMLIQRKGLSSQSCLDVVPVGRYRKGHEKALWLRNSERISSASCGVSCSAHAARSRVRPRTGGLCAEQKGPSCSGVEYLRPDDLFRSQHCSVVSSTLVLTASSSTYHKVRLLSQILRMGTHIGIIVLIVLLVW
jgi:hypothetical protein